MEPHLTEAIELSSLLSCFSSGREHGIEADENFESSHDKLSGSLIQVRP